MAPFEAVFSGKITCGECKKSCKGQAVRLTDKYFHVKCFKCKECNKQLAAGGFYSKDDKYYCAEDYQRLFGTKCADCGKFVEGEVVTALGNTYHQHCFHCTKCNNKFAAGDKVTFTGQDYMCTKCLEKYEKAMAKKEARPVSPEEKIVATPSAPVTSTPAKPQTPPEATHISESDGGMYHNGAMSPISLSSDESFLPRRYVTSTGDTMVDDPELHFLGAHDDDRAKSPAEGPDDVFTFDEPTRDSGIASPDSTLQKDRLSPIQQIMMYRSHSPASTLSRSSRKSPESTGSYEPKYDVDYGRFYNQSYLKPQPKPFMRGPSINPTDKPKSPHFHRPENFSYTQVRRDYIKPLKKESSSMMSALGDAEQMSKRKMESVVPMNNEEPIKLSKIPDGSQESERLAPIERDDWPSPPAPAAAYPELLRDHNLRKSQEIENGDEKRSTTPDPRIQRDIDELAKIKENSGVGKSIMKSLERKRDKSPVLDPRSASRTPSASKEPPYKTRYESPVFASPRPGYGLTSPKSATLPATNRAGSYDPYEHYSEHNKENGEPPMESRSYHTSRSSVEDEFDPETGLRKSKQTWRSSGSNFNSSSYMAYRRSMPSMLKGDEPPKLYPYEQLLLTNYKLPPGTDRNTLEMHLSKEEFESIFHLRREEFYRLAEWKRNDLKKRVGLY